MANVEKREITKELGESYLDYAMSMIVARALPDVRDGMKPVHRRMLWDMWDSGLTVAREVQEVGERGRARCWRDTIRMATSPIYDTMVRMAQDFSLRYPLVQRPGKLRLHRRRFAGGLPVYRGASSHAIAERDAGGHRKGNG